MFLYSTTLYTCAWYRCLHVSYAAWHFLHRCCHMETFAKWQHWSILSRHKLITKLCYAAQHIHISLHVV